jgi:flagellar M-ring protein FliF
MQTIKSYLDHYLLVWKDSTAAARFGIILLLVICVGAIIGVGIWSAQPQYVTVARDVDSRSINELINELEQANISYKLSTAGSGVQVDYRDVGHVNMIANRLGISSQTPELEELSPWADPLSQQDARRRNQEAILSAKITSMNFIKSARVSLSIPDKQPFLRPTDLPKASVLLELMPGRRPADDMAMSIASLVSGAVPNLRPEQVSITDTDGRPYSLDASLQQLTKQEEYRVKRELELAYKAQMILDRICGFGNSTVQVSASFTFPDTTTESTEFDPDKKVMKREKIDSSQLTNDSGLAVGPPGVNANLTGASQGSQKTTLNKMENVETDFEVSKTIYKKVEQTPTLDQLSISVLVNSDAMNQADGQPLTAEAKTGIENLIKQAIGFRDSIDKFDLEFLPFAENVDLDVPAPTAFPWDQVNQILKNISLGIAALVALLLGLKAIKNLQPIPISGSSANAMPTDRASQVSQLSEMVKENPEVFSKIISAWANESEPVPEQRSQKQERAA